MAIVELRRKVKTLVNQSRTNIGAEIDTDVECDPIGTIPVRELKKRSLKS